MSTRVRFPSSSLALFVLGTSCVVPPPATNSAGAAPTGARPAAEEIEPTESSGPADDGAPGPEVTRGPTMDELRKEAGRVLDDWHDAASRGDRDRYLGHLSPDAVFLGTDASERWDLATFTAYVDEWFPKGGWTYAASNRHVVLGPEARVAWFDETLENESYGELRGSGALRRVGDTWRIAQYNMTFTVPNDIAPEVTDAIRAFRQAPGADR